MAIKTGDLGSLNGFNEVISGAESIIENVFCCDLLSLAISRAPDKCAWITVMGNVNTVAVASLREIGAIVLAEGISPDAAMLESAKREEISVLTTALPVYEAAKQIDEATRRVQ